MFKAYIISGSPQDYLARDRVYIGKENDFQLYQLAALKLRGKHFIIQLQGIDQLEKAQPLAGQGVFVHRQDMPKLEEDQFYWKDVIGLAVHHPSAGLVGKLVDLIDTGWQTTLVLADEAGEEFLVPLAPDTLQGLEEEQIWLDFPLELLELNRSKKNKNG